MQKTLESPLDCKEIQPVHSKGDQSWIFVGRTDAEVETPILWPPDVKSWLTGKDPDAGKDWGQKKRAAEAEVAGWRHWLSGHESEQTPEIVEDIGPSCPWGRKESDTTEHLNNDNHVLQSPPEGRAGLSGLPPALMRAHHLPSVSVLPLSWKALWPRPEFAMVSPQDRNYPCSLGSAVSQPTLSVLCLQTLNPSDPLGVDPAPMF